MSKPFIKGLTALVRYATLRQATVGDTLQREPKGKMAPNQDSSLETLRQKDYRKLDLWRDHY